MPSGGPFGKENLSNDGLKDIAKTLYVDSFIISYFKVLPTEERYQSLTQTQKLLIYFMTMFAPNGDDMKRMAIEDYKKENLKFGDADKDMLKKLGLNEVDINKEISEMVGSFK